MIAKHVAIGIGCLLCAALAAGCGQPKQVQPVTGFEDTGEADIAEQEDKEIEPAVKMPDEMNAAEKKAACCEQCTKGLAKDRTGQPPEQIPCADFTADLEEWCLNYFRDHAMMASECQAVAKPAASATPDAGSPDAAAPPPPAGR